MENHAMDMIPVCEAGECIHPIFVHSDEYKNKDIGLSSDKKTIQQYADVLNKLIQGKTFKASEVDIL
jgi:hypothetical protein